MDNYFDLINKDLVNYVIGKLITGGVSDDLVNFSDFNEIVKTILNDDKFYLSFLNHYQPLQFLYKKLSNIKSDWIDKYLLYKTLKNLMPFAMTVLEALENGTTMGHKGVYVNAEHHSYRGGENTIMSLNYLDIPGINYQNIKLGLLGYLDAPTEERYVCQMDIGEKDYRGFKLLVTIGAENLDMKYVVFLDEQKLIILLIGILYSGQRIVDPQGRDFLGT